MLHLPPEAANTDFNIGSVSFSSASNVQVSGEEKEDDDRQPVAGSGQHDLGEKPSIVGSLESSTSAEPTPSSTSQKFRMPLLREVPFVIIICSSNILTQASLGMTIAPLNIIGKSFGMLNPGQLSWFVAAYSLTVGTFILVAGRLGDMYGHKLMFISGFFFYALWSLIAGFTAFSHSQIFFDFCRAMQGIGPALMVPNSLAILGRVYPPGRRKEMVFSIYGATAPNGFILGSVFGSLLAEQVWWPWEFWVLAIACCVLGLLGVFVLPSAGVEDGTKPVQQFDYLGAITGVAGLVLFNIAWNQAPIVGWSNAYVIVFLILGILIIGLFLFVETRVSQPLIPRSALSGKVGFVLGCIALGWSSFGIWIYYYFQFLTNLRHISPLLASAQNTPAGVAGICASLTTGYILSRVPTSRVMAVAMLPFCIGNILLATMPVNQTYWIQVRDSAPFDAAQCAQILRGAPANAAQQQSFLSTIITPWGMDMSFPAGTIILSDLVPKEHQGIAASLVVTIVNYSISIGLGIAGTVEVHVNEGGSNEEKGYRAAFYAAIGLSGLGFILAMLFVFQETKFRGARQ